MTRAEVVVVAEEVAAVMPAVVVTVVVAVVVRRPRDARRRRGDVVRRRWRVMHWRGIRVHRGAEPDRDDGRTRDGQDAEGRQSPTESCSEHCTHVRQPFRPVPSEPAVRPRQPLAGQR